MVKYNQFIRFLVFDLSSGNEKKNQQRNRPFSVCQLIFPYARINKHIYSIISLVNGSDSQSMMVRTKYTSWN